MVYILARHVIEEYEQWEAHHEANTETRVAHGSLGTRVFRVRDGPNEDGLTEVVVLQEVADDRLEEMLAYYGSTAFEDVLEAAGVVEVVDADIVETVHDATG